MQRAVDNVLAVTKESVKTITYESLNNIVRLINGVSALLLAILPGKASILEGMHGWELRPTFRGPRFPRWMENGVSSFNQFIHELSVDSDTSSSADYSSGEDYSDEDGSPSTPLSQSSRVSRASSFGRHDRCWGLLARCFRCMFTWILFPARFLIGILLYIYHASLYRGSIVATTSGNMQPSDSTKKANTLKDHVVQRATDRRRGLIEDLHLGIEIFIEAVFDVVHKAARCLISPLDTSRTLLRWFSFHRSKDIPDSASDASVPTATLGETDPTPTERPVTFRDSLNTDARTCRDVITELGYPYEAIRVVTADGYVLLLERIPRREARKVVYLQHGVFDSSMGWVSNGVVGSPAFAAFDEGYDVFLGNFRGLVSREHIDKNISSRQYWRYSINEHGTEDIPAMIEKIHEVKISELKTSQPNLEEEETNGNHQPYKISAICHSLGGAGILMYVITRRIEEKPHRLSRLILLSPAGFHHDSSFLFKILEYLFRWLAPILEPLVPGFYIPTRFFRMLLNKLARDLHNYPAVGGLVQTLMSYVAGGDSSNWVGVLGLPHYNMNDMPGVSFHVALHLAQILHSKKFRMFDYGSAATNLAIYGSPEPLDLGEYYGFIDIPVDLVAGRNDQVIRPSMVKKHYKLMRDAGVEVSFNEFEYAHLDFTFSHREELLAYIMSRLLLVEPVPKQKYSRLKKKKEIDEGLTRRLKTTSKAIDKILESIIDEHEQDAISGHRRLDSDFVDVFLHLKNNYSSTHDQLSNTIDRTNIKAILLDMIFGAIDTSHTAIEWTMSELIRHPRVMKKLQEELDTIAGENEIVEEAHLPKLEYLDMVVKENLRLHPVAPLLIPHESIEDIVLNGYYIPKKSQIIVNNWGLGQDPDVWSDNVLEFLPERFIGKNIDLRGQHFQLLPFGSGRRGCPGIYLGLINIKLVMAHLVHCFNWELPIGMSPAELDMDEKFGLSLPRAKHLLAIPTLRL